MSMELNKMESVIKDLVAHLHDPEFSDVKIVCSDGAEILSNKSILGMRSQYFHSMFSNSSNFVESKADTVKLPYTKAVLEKVLLYLYSGKMICHDLSLRSILELMELLDLMNLSEEFSTLEDFTSDRIVMGEFIGKDCLQSFEDSLKFGKIGKTLQVYLKENVRKISKLAEVGGLSEAMMRKLLQEKMDDPNQTVLQLNMLITWLSVNTVNTETKKERHSCYPGHVSPIREIVLHIGYFEREPEVQDLS